MFCQECGTKLTEGAAACSQCGTAAGQSQNSSGPQPGAQSGSPQGGTPNQDAMGSFLSFDLMITPSIMKIVYIVGSIVIALGALVAMFTGGVPGFFAGLIGGAIALVYFRVLCELMVLFFKMHEELKQIRTNTGQK